MDDLSMMDKRELIRISDELLTTYLPPEARYPLLGYISLLEIRRVLGVSFPPMALYVHGSSSLSLLSIAQGFYGEAELIPSLLFSVSPYGLHADFMRGSTLLTYSARVGRSASHDVRDIIARNLESIARGMDGLLRTGVIVSGEVPLGISESNRMRYYEIDVGDRIGYGSMLYREIAVDCVLNRARTAYAGDLRKHRTAQHKLPRAYAMIREQLCDDMLGRCDRRKACQVAALMTGWTMMDSWVCSVMDKEPDHQSTVRAYNAIIGNITTEVHDDD